MQNLFNITNKSEIHYRYPYKDGLNILQQPFQKEGSCVPGGFYFTDKENLPDFYQHGDTRPDDGMWSGNSEGGWIRCIEVPSDALIVKDPDETQGIKWRCDKIIFLQKYPLYDLNTIKTLNLYINRYYIERACMLGKTDILEWWLKTCKNQNECMHYLMDIASEYGHVDILELLKNSGFPLIYSHEALDQASKKGYIHVLKWWRDSGLPLKYTDWAMTYASRNNHINVLEWWLESGLPLMYFSYALQKTSPGQISDESYMNILNWWKNSRLPIQFPAEGLNGALLCDDFELLEWLEQSGMCVDTLISPIISIYSLKNDRTIEWLRNWKNKSC